MADEREGAHQPPPQPASETRIQSGGRQENAAQPLNAAEDRGGPERYPPVDRSDAVESRSFDPAADAPTPRQGAGDASPKATQQGRLGPEGDPAEGKR
jgi:hypothetical protein